MDTTPNRLVELFLEHTDHISDWWEHYLRIYQRELASRISLGTPIRLLQFGIRNGRSLQIWSKYLPPGSSILGIDIDERCASLETPSNVRICVGDASDPEQLLRMLGGETFEIIIDDASRRSPDIIAAFETGFARLKPGGLYFLENLHYSYAKAYAGGFRHPRSAIEWLKGLVDAVNADHLENDPSTLRPDETARLERFKSTLARVTFYDSVAVIEKLQKPKTHPSPRMLAGSEVPVADGAPVIWSTQTRQLEVCRPAPATSEAKSQAWAAIPAAAKDETQASGTIAASDAARRKQTERQPQERAIAEGALRQRDEVSTASAEEMALLRLELGRLKSEIQRMGGEIPHSPAALNTAEADVSDYAEKLDSLEMALARSDANLQAILTSTSWQVARRLAAAAARLPPGGRRLARRVLHVASWAAKGQLREKVALYLNARHTMKGALHQPQSRPASVPQPFRKKLVDRDVYQQWWSANAPQAFALRLQRRVAETLDAQPTFSVIVPVFQPPEAVFTAMVASVQAQSYQRWELVLAIVDTGVQSAALLRYASQASQSDPRIRVTVLPVNLGIAGNSNAALARATGDWIVLLDHDDVISSDALFRFAESLNRDPAADFLYSDKDMIDLKGKRHFSPLMKPAWSPDIMLNANFLTHLCALRTDLVRGFGGWDSETDGAQDWDLFLRAYLASPRIRHVPYVLYHWRQIPTSVSMGGLAAKPYAADAQLRTLRKYLPAAGWNGAEPEFGTDYIRIRWASNGLRVSVIVVGLQAIPPAADQGVEVIAADARRPVAGVDAAIEQASGDVIIILDAAFVPKTPDWIAELAYPLSNPDVAMVAGKILDRNDKIVDFGIFFQDGIAYPAWRHRPEYESGPFGWAGWYRNVPAAAGGAVAFRRALWSDLGGFAAFAKNGRADLGFSLAAATRGRILANPFASFTATNGPSVFETKLPPLKPEAVREALPNGDPFLHPNLEVKTTPGLPLIAMPEPVSLRAPPHDFAAEARYTARRFDVEASEIAASVEACSKMPAARLRHVLWLIPNFQVPFFGGIHTILRVADYLRRHHDVKHSFAVYGEPNTEAVRARIARAFPDLAATVQIKSMAGGGDAPSFGPVDVAFATLWSTAFPLLRMRDVRRKCYFLQDWEPLFYPAGTLSGTVESTYRFGFHAICNTESLAVSYRQMGGTADYFLPAVDTKIFNANGRVPRRPGDPFVLFCYGRTTTPRNCFEALAEALAVVKRKYGDAIEIVFAGSDWDPADYGLAGMVRNLGLLSYAETGQLYRMVDAGLVAMATRHPSYLPFELMASGAAVVTTRNIYTSWLFEDNENCLLCETTRSDITRAISILVEQPETRDRIAERGQDLVMRDHADWDATCRRITDQIRAISE